MNRPLVAKSLKDESSPFTHTLSSSSTLSQQQHHQHRQQQQQQQQQGLDQQIKRRKVNNEGSNSVSATATTASKEDSTEKVTANSVPVSVVAMPSHLKPLLPHPPTPTRQSVLPPSPPSQTPSASPPPPFSSTTHYYHGDLEAESQSDGDDSGSEGDHDGEDGDDDDDDEYRDDQDEDDDDEDMESIRGRGSRYDVEMREVGQEPSEDEDDNSDDSEDMMSTHHLLHQQQQQYQHHNQKQQRQRQRQQQQKQKQPKQKQPRQQNSNFIGGGTTIECANCGQTETPLWRKDAKGQSICNACGLYARLHQRDRPVTMRKSNIARRKRDWATVQEKKAAAQAQAGAAGQNQSQGQGGFVGDQSLSGGVKNKKSRAQGQHSRKRKGKALSDDYDDRQHDDEDAEDVEEEEEGVEENATSRRVEVLAMNIPVSNEDESDHHSDEHPQQMPTPVSNASPSPLLVNSMATSMALASGSLSPASLTASPPTPVLASPNFLNTATSSSSAAAAAAAFAHMNPLLVQQYHQQLQNQAAALTAAVAAANLGGPKSGTVTPGSTDGLSSTLLGNTNTSNNNSSAAFNPTLYPQYPSTPFLHESTLPQDPMALAGLQLQQQALQHEQAKLAAAAAVAGVGPLTPANLSGARQPFSPSVASASKPNPIVTDTQAPLALQQQRHQHPSQPQPQSQSQSQSQSHLNQQHRQRQTGPDSKKPSTSGPGTGGNNNPLILDSTRFTRLMNQMSKPQLSMFLTILEERCGALRHRLAGEDDSVHRVDQNEMMLMFNHPSFAMDSTGFSGGGIGIGTSSGYYGAAMGGGGGYSGGASGSTALTNLMALNDMGQHRERAGHLRTLSNASSPDYMMQ
ncbi:Transcription factor GATA-4 [Mortierella sp. AD031]|nr:Transcription factor GATA-4 [Mortierella sp. AD031]